MKLVVYVSMLFFLFSTVLYSINEKSRTSLKIKCKKSLGHVITSPNTSIMMGIGVGITAGCIVSKGAKTFYRLQGNFIEKYTGQPSFPFIMMGVVGLNVCLMPLLIKAGTLSMKGLIKIIEHVNTRLFCTGLGLQNNGNFNIYSSQINAITRDAGLDSQLVTQDLNRYLFAGKFGAGVSYILTLGIANARAKSKFVTQ